MSVTDAIRAKIAGAERLSRAEGIALLREGDLLELGSLADSVRERTETVPSRKRIAQVQESAITSPTISSRKLAARRKLRTQTPL